MITEGSRPTPRRISKIIATTVDLPLVPVTAIERFEATKCASNSERCTTGTPRARAAAMSGTLFFDRGRNHQGGAVVGDAAPILRQDRDAESLELRARAGAFTPVEAAVAAARTAAAHGLELRQRAHAAAGQPGVVKASARQRIGQAGVVVRHDHHRIAIPHLIEQLGHVGVREPHAAMRVGPPEARFVIGAVQVNVARQGIHARAPVHAVLEALERQYAREDQIFFAWLAAPHRAGRDATLEHRARFGAGADALVHAMPAGRGFQRAVRAADSGARGRDRPFPERAPLLDSHQALAAHVHQQQTVGQLAKRRSRPREREPRQRQGALRLNARGGNHARANSP